MAGLIPQQAYEESESSLADAVIKPLTDSLTQALGAYQQTAQQAASSFHLPHPSEIFGGGPSSSIPSNAQVQPSPSLSLPHPADLFGAPPQQEQQPAPAASSAPAPAPAYPRAASGVPVAMPSGQPSTAGDGSPPQALTGGDRPARIAAARGYADAAEARTGVPADVNLAFAVHESGLEDRYGPGNSFHGRHAVDGEDGTPITDWGYDSSGNRVDYPTKLKSYQTPAGSFDDFADLIANSPRYRPALDRYRQTGDKDQLIRDIWAAGYGESKTGPDETVNIRQNQTAGGSAAPQIMAQPPAASGQPQAMPEQASGQYTAGSYTPNQINAATSEGLDYETALAVCGPAAAIAFARKNGRNPTMSEAVNLAKQVGWTSALGMAGPASEQQLLKSMGVAARLVDGAPDWQSVAADVQRGNPVIVSTPGHYFVAERYDPQNGAFDFGESAAVLKASGGRRWFRPDELASLGMGTPRASLFMDSPTTPEPSVVAGRSAPTAGDTPAGEPPASSSAAPPAAGPGGSNYKLAASGLPASVLSAGDQKRAKLGLRNSADSIDQNAQSDMLRAPLGPANMGPDTTGANDSLPFDPREQDAGPRESGYTEPAAGPTGEVTFSGDQGLSSPAAPTTYGASQDDPGTAPLPFDAAPDITYLPSTAPLQSDRANMVETPVTRPGAPVAASYGASQDDPGQAPAPPRVEQAGMPAPSGFPGLQAVYDSAGNFLHWIQGAADQIGQNVQGNRQAVEDANAGQSGGVNFGQGIANAAQTVAPYVKPMGGALEMRQRMREIEDQAASDQGRTDLRAQLGDAVNDPAWRAAHPDLAAEYDDLSTQFALVAGGMTEPIRPGPTAADAAAGPNLAERARSAFRGNQERVAAADARMARQGSVAAPGTLGVISNNPLEASTAARSRIVPPDVADSLDFPLNVPTDPGTINAIEAAGGSVDPERGVNLNLIRYQGPEAHGQPATRGSTFYTAGKPGAPSPYAAGQGAQVGGSDRIEGPTRFRNPMVLSDAPGSGQGFDEGVRQLGLANNPAVEAAQTHVAEADAAARAAQKAYTDAGAVLDALEAQTGRKFPGFIDEPLRGVRTPEETAAWQRMGEADDRLRDSDRALYAAQEALKDARRAIPSNSAIDNGINQARRAGPPGSPERAQALKDLVSKYGGDPNVIDDLLRVRGADDSESAWAIKENILAHNARKAGYDGVLTVQQSMSPTEYQNALEKAVQAHPDYQAQQGAIETISQEIDRLEAQRKAIPSQGGDMDRAYARVDNAIEDAMGRATDAEIKLQKIHDRLMDEVHVEAPSKITELADFREGANPTPGVLTEPFDNIRVETTERGLYRVAEYDGQGRFAGFVSGEYRTPEQAELARYRYIEREWQGRKTPPGYTLRSDMRRRGGETSATLTPGIGASTRILGDISNAIGGGVGGATIGAGLPADTPEERRRNALIGAGVGMVAGPAAGRLMSREGGALATFGASPNYHGPSAVQMQQAAQQGAQRGQRLNQAVTPPGSAVPRGVRAATQVTDDRAALRWAEDMLTDLSGSPRLPADSSQRPSTMSRVNAASVGNERLATELEPALVNTAKAGLQDELPQYLEDMHHRDILDDFYNRGYQETMAQRQQAIANAQAQNRPAAVIQRMQAKAQADAEANGERVMRRRQGTNSDHTYEATDARLQVQESRLKADGRWQDLQDAAQAVWDHNATTRDRLVQADEMDAQQAADLAQRYPHYVPTVPLSHLEMGGPTVGPTSTVTRGTTPVVRALDDVGTSGERLNPIVATRNATLKAERAIQRNQVASAFADLFDQALQANPSALTPGSGPKNIWNGDTDVSFFRNGQPMTIRVPKPVADGLEASANMGMSANAVTAAWKRVTAAVAQTLTASRATFLPVNLIRDFQDYAATTAIREGGAQRLPGVVGAWLDQAGNAAVDILRAQANARGAGGAAIGAITGAAQGDENTTPGERVRHAAEGAVAGTLLLGANKVRATGASRDFLARGGGMGVAPTSFRAGERWYRDLLAQGGVGIRTPGEAARYLGDWLSDIASLQGVRGINERTELISRTAAMRRADAAGAGPVEAMIAGRDASVDFERGGALVRAINGFIPFTNASVQGSAQLVRMLKRNPPAAATTIAATTALPLLAAEAWNRSDPQRAQVYDDVPDYAKNTGLVVVMPWAGSDSRGERPNWLWIPTGNLTPFVIGMRAAMQYLPGLEPTASTLNARGDSEAQRWAGVLGNVLEAFSPVRGDSLGAAASAMIPPVAKQAVELGMNRDIFRGSDIVTDQADERASAASKAVAGGLNEAGRRVGNDWLQNVHPSAIEYLIRQPAAYGDLVTGASDMAAPSGEKQAEQRPVQNEPFVGGMAGRFIRDTGGGNLGRARDNRLTDETRSVLQEAGMRPEDVLPVGGTWKNGPLTRDEQVAWQEAMNDEVDRAMLRVRQNPKWRNPTTQEAAVREAFATARENAARRAHLPSEAEMQRRIRDAQSRKAS